MFRKATLLTLCLCAAHASFVVGQQTKVLQHHWEIDPPLGEVWDQKQDPPNVRLDIGKLRSRFAEDRLETAQYVYLQHGNPNFKQKAQAIEVLLDSLQAGEENTQIRRAMVSAVLALTDSSKAEIICSIAKSDSALLPLVERKLVEWKSPIAIADWRQRITAPSASPTELATALEGLAVVGNDEDRTALEGVIRASHTSLANKFLAASALGTLAADGLNAFAQTVMDSDLVHRHLLAAHLLKRHSGATTASQMRRIIAEGDGSAQLVAYESMVQNMPDVCFGYAQQMVSHPDSKVRKIAVQFLQTRPDATSIRMQATLLKDRNPEVRNIVSKNLLENARQGHRELVCEIVAAYMNSDSWEGIEQSIRVAVGLQERVHCTRFIDLLVYPRPEVKIAAGWALMELGDEPEILARLLETAQKFAAELKSQDILVLEDQVKLSYLLEAFGKNNLQAASPFLEKFIPKGETKYGIVNRASAIWALGKLNKGADNKGLRDKLYGRMSDFGPIVAEDFLVRFMCHVALGEMAHPESREMLEKYRESLPSPVGYAGSWALLQLDQAAAAKVEK